jgi:hypothetical protein
MLLGFYKQLDAIDTLYQQHYQIVAKALMHYQGVPI